MLRRLCTYLGIITLLVGGLVTLTPELKVASETEAKLRWSPPELVDPETIELGTGATSTVLENDKDYIIKLPDEKKVGYTWIRGGRNIVMIGGHITTPTGYETTSERRAIYIREATGTVHIEGILIDSSGGGEHDAIAINAPDATVQIQNVRVNDLTGTEDTEHSDFVQPWGGVKELRIDRFTGSTNYQGFYLIQTQDPIIGPSFISNTNLIHQENPDQNVPSMIWLSTSSCEWHPTSVSFENVYIQPHESLEYQYEVEPATDRAGCPAVLNDGVLSWPTVGWIEGEVHEGAPVDGDFVPEGLAGLAYASPGYVGDEEPTPTPTATPTPEPSPTVTPEPSASPTPTASNPVKLTISTGHTFDNAGQISLSGQAPANAKVQVEVHSTPQTGTVTADESGNWTWTPPNPLEPGEHQYRARLANDDGSFGEWTDWTSFSVLGVSDDLPGTGADYQMLIFASIALIGAGIGLKVHSSRSTSQIKVTRVPKLFP